VQNVSSDFLGNFLNTMRGPLTKLANSEEGIYWQLLERGGGLRIVDKLMHYLSDRREHHSRWLRALENPRLPIHAVIGEADPVWGEEIKEYLERHLPNVGITRLPEIGHYPHLEDPEGVLGACSEFVPGW
jgi:pimeloyl-ACP methyl ester carboxylesterase